MKKFNIKPQNVKATMITSILLSSSVIVTQAKDTPTFDAGQAKTAANGFLTPLSDTALWAIPLIALVVIAVSGISWLSKDEDEKEQKPFTKTVKRIVFVSILVECAPVLLKIFGIA